MAQHLDHVHPLSRGGEDVESNIIPACAECNLSKGAKTLAEWVQSWT
jgi:5-methylcytosine-specific restriction endonuclease McrA